ncbi:MAG: hypothetical protein AB1679_35670 [Actinomycetota bacterium]
MRSAAQSRKQPCRAADEKLSFIKDVLAGLAELAAWWTGFAELEVIETPGIWLSPRSVPRRADRSLP